MELRKTRSSARVPAQVLDELGNPKSCVDCKTTRTPMWRRGPTGSKSLCNACGIRVRKQEQGLLPNPEGKSKKRKSKKKFNMPAAASASTSNIDGESSTCTTAAKGNGGGGQDSIKLVAMSSLKLVLQKQKVVKTLSYKKKRSNIRRWRKLPEVEEQAAFALMALSYGYKSSNLQSWLKVKLFGENA